MNVEAEQWRAIQHNEHTEVVEIILKDPETRPDPNNFESMYGKEVVAADLAITQRLKIKFEARDAESPEARSGHMLSEAFERISRTWAPLLGWFGPKAEVRPTSEYDDYVNGVDAVLVLPGEKSPEFIALAIDVSRNADEARLADKLDRAMNHVTGATKPMMIKYFEHKNIRGQLESIIPVVIGVDSRDCQQIIETFGQVIRLTRLRKQNELSPKQKSILEQKVAELRQHPVQRVFLEEINAQLKMYERLLTTGNYPNSNVSVEGVKLVSDMIKKILDDKSELSLGDLAEDQVFKKIIELSQ